MVLQPRTAVWRSPEVGDTPDWVAGERLHIEVLEQRLLRLQPPGRVIHTEIRMYRFRRDGQDFWVAPDVRQDAEGLSVHDRLERWHALGGGLLAVAGLVLAVVGWRCAPLDRVHGASAALPTQSRCTRIRHLRPILLVTSLICFHYAWLAYLVVVYPHTHQSPTDEIGYFQASSALLHGDLSQPFQYTLGYPIVCLPFVALLPHADPYLRSKVISFFSALVMQPVILGLAFLLLRRVCGSATRAFGAILLWQIIPKLFVAVELPSQGVAASPFGVFHTSYIFMAYQYALCGFNSQSEWASLAVLLGCALLAQGHRPRPTWAKYTLHGMLFGVACLIRLNNVFWAPLLAYLLWSADRDGLSNPGRLCRMVLLSLTAFMAIFGWQLAANRLQFGHAFVFPYILHGQDIHAGFSWRHLARGTAYYFSVFAVPLYLALPALAVMREPRRRAVLSFWVLPMLLFFCGFCVIGQHYRFLLPLFYGMTAAIVCVEFWDRLSLLRATLLVSLLVIPAIPSLPLDWGWNPWAHWQELDAFGRLRLISFLPLTAICCWTFRRDRQILWFVAAYTVLVLMHSPWLCFALAIVLAGRAGLSLAGEWLEHAVPSGTPGMAIPRAGQAG